MCYCLTCIIYDNKLTEVYIIYFILSLLSHCRSSPIRDFGFVPLFVPTLVSQLKDLKNIKE